MYQYNGKEKQDELDLGWLDYGARMYMPDVGRFTTIDPLVGLVPGVTPYHYVYNNPIVFTDPSGMYTVYDFDGNPHTINDGDVKDGYLNADHENPNIYEFESKGGKTSLTKMEMRTSNPDENAQTNFTFNGRRYKANSLHTLRGRDDKLDGIGSFSGITQLDQRSLLVVLGHGSFIIHDLYRSLVEKAALSESGEKDGRHGFLDYKHIVYDLFDIADGDLLQINGKVYNANEAGNFLWGMVLEYNASFISANYAADLVSRTTLGRSDEPWEQRAITEGRNFGMKLYQNESVKKEVFEIRKEFIDENP